MCLYEFDEERFIRQTKQEGYEIGYEAGTIDLLLKPIQKKLSKGKDIQTIADELEQDISVIEKYLEKATCKE